MADPFSVDTIDETIDITVDTLVGEGRKYKDPNELAKAYANADSYIAKLKAAEVEKDAELKVLRDIAEARAKVDPAHDDSQSRQVPPVIEPPKVETPDISELVRKELLASNEEKKRADNINRAAEVLNGHFGSPAKAQEAMRARATELGVSFEWLKTAAETSPSAFFATMGVKPDSRSSSTPGYQPEAVRIDYQSGKKGMAHFESIRKADPKAYYSPEVQKQLFAARRELGENFYRT